MAEYGGPEHKEIDKSLHILTLVVKNLADIPKVRAKAKLFAGMCEFDRISVTQTGTAASEMARLLVKISGGGAVTFNLVCCAYNSSAGYEQSGIELVFEGKRPCDPSAFAGGVCPLSLEELSRLPTIAGLKLVLDHVDIKSGLYGTPLKINALKWGTRSLWRDIKDKEASFRSRLFKDTEESYLENLKLKHEEALRLLEQITRQNRELDRMNSDLFQLGQDLETMAREHTIVQMALRIADRIRNPIAVIGGLARSIMKKDPSIGPEDRRRLETIRASVEELEGFVRDFEEYAGKELRSFATEDLRHIVDEALNTWRPGLARKGINLSVDMADGPVNIRANKRVLKTAFLHILRNALEASPVRGAIEVKVARLDGRPVVSIRDNGPGIPEDIKKRLFAAPVTTKASGTGLGLFLVKEILGEHQGEIEIESAEGKGTTVVCSFPVRWKEGGNALA